MTVRTIHVFAAAFRDEKDVLLYTQAQWQPEPGEDASDEEYEAWEDRNPSWMMKEELGCDYLDSDFIETISGAGSSDPSVDWVYLSSLIGNANVGICERAVPPETNTLILIDERALGGFRFTFNSTAKMTYCGGYLSSSNDKAL